MRLFFVTGLFISGLIAAAACCCSGPGASVALASESEAVTVERDYFVKGMTCAGCVFGVKKALNRAGVEKSQIEEVDYKKPDPEHKIGHAKVKFSKDQYKGKETDCKIIKEIKDNPGYVAYLDPANTDPCKLGK
jgi:copper chaperone CopZ